MRKSNREIRDFDEICALVARCQTMRLGLQGGEYPYIVPLSYGFESAGGKIVLYFHCAKEGKKLDLLHENNRVCVEMDGLKGYADTGHSVTADYESLIGFGRASEVFGDEAVKGLELLLSHCGVQGYSARDCAMRGIVSVWKIELDEFSAKRRFI